MIADAAHYRFSVAQYHQLGVAGILTEDDRIELLHGELIMPFPLSIAHNFSVQELSRFFIGDGEKRYIVSPQCTLLVGPASEVLPDITLLRREPREYRDRHPEPADVLLLIEVASDSIAYDRGSKLRAYAAAGIPEYWIVNLRESRVEIHRDPAGETFRAIHSAARGDTLTPAFVESDPLPLAEIFP